jgi:hypothetical protein
VTERLVTPLGVQAKIETVFVEAAHWLTEISIRSWSLAIGDTIVKTVPLVPKTVFLRMPRYRGLHRLAGIAGAHPTSPAP